MIIVRLADDTIGSVESAKVGDTVTVILHDENGIEIKKEGIIEEILVNYESWQ